MEAHSKEPRQFRNTAAETVLNGRSVEGNTSVRDAASIGFHYVSNGLPIRTLLFDQLQLPQHALRMEAQPKEPRRLETPLAATVSHGLPFQRLPFHSAAGSRSTHWNGRSIRRSHLPRQFRVGVHSALCFEWAVHSNAFVSSGSRLAHHPFRMGAPFEGATRYAFFRMGFHSAMCFRMGRPFERLPFICLQAHVSNGRPIRNKDVGLETPHAVTFSNGLPIRTPSG